MQMENFVGHPRSWEFVCGPDRFFHVFRPLSDPILHLGQVPANPCLGISADKWLDFTNALDPLGPINGFSDRADNGSPVKCLQSRVLIAPRSLPGRQKNIGTVLLSVLANLVFFADDDV
jgi:hypothetical protein